MQEVGGRRLITDKWSFCLLNKVLTFMAEAINIHFEEDFEFVTLPQYRLIKILSGGFKPL